MDELGGTEASIAAFDDLRGARVVAIAGEVDISNVGGVEAEFAALVGAARRPVVVDLSALAFMDSSGVAMLLRAAEKAGPLTIRDPSPIVRQLIAASGLAEVLRIEG